MNDSAKHFLKQHYLGISYLIIAIGVICILFASLLSNIDHPDLKNVLLGVGSSLVASSIAALLMSQYLSFQNQGQKIIDDWRLIGVFDTRSEANWIPNERLPNARELDIIALGLKSFRDRHNELIRGAVQKGLKIRILVPSPDSGHVASRNKAENNQQGQLKKEIEDLLKWCEGLLKRGSVRGSVHVRVYDAPTLDFYFCVDDVLLTGPYLHGISSQQTPTYAFSINGKGYKLWGGFTSQAQHAAFRLLV